jgi:FkbH-like protein
MMDWLPVHADFRGAVRAALETQTDVGRLDRLAALANHRLSFLEVIQLDRALTRVDAVQSSAVAPIRVALLSSATVDQLVPGIRVAGLRRRLLFDTHIGPYGQYRQEVLDPESGLHRFRPQVVLFALTAREATAGIPVTASPSEVDAAIHHAICELRVLWQRARDQLKVVVIQQNFLNVAEPLFGSFDRLVPGAPAAVIDRLNMRLAEAASEDGVLLLDVARAAARDGIDAWFDAPRWLQGKMEIAPAAAPTYGELLARIIAAQRGLSKKCLVLDLDNTLWGGVIGDDGVEGIVLGEGSAAGEAHLALQRYAKQLQHRGVVLAVCSKNERAIAESVFRDHPEMHLERSDIAAFIANWTDKAANLQHIAEQLNIGLDSLVFVDDNPAERARIRESLPSVAVPELPNDPAQWVRCLADAGYFEATSFTDEDRIRNAQYAANASRDNLRELSQSVDEFLSGLEMSVTYGPFRPVDLARVTQLINKTNQFNTTTRRYTAAEVSAFASSEQCLTLQFRLADRFGDNGLVSAMVLRINEQDRSTVDIDTWVMSCRVFGRQLEEEAMNIAVEASRNLGARQLRADFLPTPKNALVSKLYPLLGFNRASCDPPVEGGSRWLLNLSDYIARETHIARRSE